MPTMRDEMSIDVEQGLAGIDTLIERRSPERSEANELADLWAASARRRHRERKRRKNSALWYEFFSRMADSHARLSENYERRAVALLEEPPCSTRAPMQSSSERRVPP